VRPYRDPFQREAHAFNRGRGACAQLLLTNLGCPINGLGSIAIFNIVEGHLRWRWICSEKRPLHCCRLDEVRVAIGALAIRDYSVLINLRCRTQIVTRRC
jgi:hypothetical protein